MGHSAKVHKRVAKKSAAPSASQPKPTAPCVPSVQSARKRAGLKSKTKTKTKARSSREGAHVLGGADYVTLLSGGRKRAAEEALKLPTGS